ncbi:MAG: hypothetical protein LBV58_00950 [Acholeplasmatales bacterium]|nr:hypothetical protein [Acholeplasmatales bacterium]
MSKNLLSKLVIGFAALAAVVLWILSIALKEQFGWYSLNWGIVIVSVAAGLVLFLGGLFEKNVGVIKKTKVYIGLGLIFIGFVALVPTIFAQEDEFWGQYGVALIAALVVVAWIFGVISVGGKKWDQGDNKNAGYKTYSQRKAEEEKNNKG